MFFVSLPRPFIVLNIPKPIKPMRHDVHILMVRVHQVVIDLDWALATHASLEGHLAINEEALHRAINI